ncbi:chemotaxis protein CheW [Brevibacillus laterosporus]|uniref:chemotaxis protein CheW n=1 Tax=Brevibacillus laterosporus TaxID=1465 RepID=UPI000366A0B4|nr:chemotaxis protein CheW [Brevibacillus laterosporus]ATO48446.1 chemotaxis protein CheW [Brevibacillus laterosporus DSM 25]MBG9771765.1 chemotaxis protein CheW [Brevibacillus laterosporus]MBG9797814.1 chemotaxis protein CheW [Brevibacillus laterosporus]MBG9802318.1 chemotaxis protein CheW [Brevibacillus laterosporus]MCR8940031.1 chemotaxis protein CheW [Brevibacillus laterosporus]
MELNQDQLGLNQSQSEVEALSYILFTMGNETFGFPLENVLEIVKPMPITKVPKSPEYVEGVINLRGNILAILQIRKMFGLPSIELTEESRFIVLKIDGFEAGIVVDGVSEVAKIAPSSIKTAPPVVAGLDGSNLAGIAQEGERLLLLLDLPTIFAQWIQPVTSEA